MGLDRLNETIRKYCLERSPLELLEYVMDHFYRTGWSQEPDRVLGD